MGSQTKTTEGRRRNKRAKIGQGRKRVLRGKGTTPKFPVHKDGQN